jgi:SAM-dependent methyltransferase
MTEDVQREFFDRLARRYDGRFLRTRWPRNQELKAAHVVDVLGPTAETGPLVELGCGTGQIAQVLLRSHPRLTYLGLDLSEPMLEIARSRLQRFGNRAELTPVSGPRLPLELAKYAAAFGVDVLHHVDEPVTVLRSLRKGLKPGAPVVFLEGNPRFPITTVIALMQREERGLLRIGFKNLRRWFEAAGFEAVDVRYGPLYTPPGPPKLVPLLELADRAAAAIPFVRGLAIFYTASGRVPARTSV